MQIGELIRGFPEPGVYNKPEKPQKLLPTIQILPIGESDKPHQFDFPKLDSIDIKEALKQTVKEAILGRLFNSDESPNVGLFDGFNDNSSPVRPLPIENTPIENTVEESNVSYSYSSSYLESFSLDLSISDNQLSLDIAYSASFSEDINYSNNSQGIEYSSSSSYQKLLSLSLTIDLGQDGENPSILSYDLSKTSSSSETDSLSFSTFPEAAEPANDDQPSSGIAQAAILNSKLSNNTRALFITNLRDEATAIQNPGLAASSSLIQSRNSSTGPIESQQSVSFQNLLINQLQQTDEIPSTEQSDRLANGNLTTNTVIQEYLLGLR